MNADCEPFPCGPMASGEDEEHWQGLMRHQLLLPRCDSCGSWRPLGTITCSRCWSFGTTWDEAAPVGTVYTWIRSHRDFMSELDVQAPYVTVLVDLDDVPVRLLGILEDEDVSIGDRLVGEFHQPANATWTLLRWVRS